MLNIQAMKKHSALLAVFIAAFSLVLTNSSFNILLPSFMQLYGISASSAGWVILAYLLSMTITMPLTPLVVDRLGRKRAYIAGVAIYGLSSYHRWIIRSICSSGVDCPQSSWHCRWHNDSTIP
ncbi:hypothetical protein LSPH24S_03912 [Lysinibacillus sphaericus]